MSFRLKRGALEVGVGVVASLWSYDCGATVVGTGALDTVQWKLLSTRRLTASPCQL